LSGVCLLGGSQGQSLRLDACDVSSDDHLVELTFHVVLVELEVVTLEWVSVHSGVDIPAVDLLPWVRVKLHELLVVGTVGRLDLGRVVVPLERILGGVDSVAISFAGHISVEEELEWSSGER